MPEGVLPLSVGDDDTTVFAGVSDVDHFTGYGRENLRMRICNDVDAGVEVLGPEKTAPTEVTGQARVGVRRQERNFVIPGDLAEV